MKIAGRFVSINFPETDGKSWPDYMIRKGKIRPGREDYVPGSEFVKKFDYDMFIDATMFRFWCVSGYVQAW